jgi:hypothetical protein
LIVAPHRRATRHLLRRALVNSLTQTGGGRTATFALLGVFRSLRT